jgi:hypothetical protein
VLLENVGKVIIPLTIDDYPVLIVSLRFLMSVSFQRLTSQRLIRVFGHGHHPIRRFHRERYGRCKSRGGAAVLCPLVQSQSQHRHERMEERLTLSICLPTKMCFEL